MLSIFGKKKKKVSKDMHYHVYVVLLSNEVSKFHSVGKLNPKRNPFLPCVYVGMTGLTPKERFKKHKKGLKASGWVRKYGKKLIPKLFKHRGQVPTCDFCNKSYKIPLLPCVIPAYAEMTQGVKISDYRSRTKKTPPLSMPRFTFSNK